MSAIDELRNDRDAIISIVTEHYILNEQEIEEMEIRLFDNHTCSTPDNVVEHGGWVFCYHRDMGVLYIK